MPLCEKSQWLPTSFRVKTKIPVVAKKGVHNLAPFYLSMSGPPCSATLVSLLFQEQGRFSIPQDQCCSLCLACSFFPHIHMDCSLPSFMLLLKWLLFIKDLPVLFFFFQCYPTTWNSLFPFPTWDAYFYVSTWQGQRMPRYVAQCHFQVCLWGCFWMRLVFESLHWLKQIDHYNVRGPCPIHWGPKQKKNKIKMTGERFSLSVFKLGHQTSDSDWILYHRFAWFSWLHT